MQRHLERNWKWQFVRMRGASYVRDLGHGEAEIQNDSQTDEHRTLLYCKAECVIGILSS